jgi:uncharacterized protein (DUF362 family)
MVRDRPEHTIVPGVDAGREGGPKSGRQRDGGVIGDSEAELYEGGP